MQVLLQQKKHLFFSLRKKRSKKLRALSRTFYRIPKKFSLCLVGDAVAKTDFVGGIYIFCLPNLRNPVTNTESALKCGNCKNLLHLIVADSAK